LVEYGTRGPTWSRGGIGEPHSPGTWSTPTSGLCFSAPEATAQVPGTAAEIGARRAVTPEAPTRPHTGPTAHTHPDPRRHLSIFPYVQIA